MTYKFDFVREERAFLEFPRKIVASSDDEDGFKIVESILKGCDETESIVDDDGCVVVFIDLKMEGCNSFGVSVVFQVVYHDCIYCRSVDKSERHYFIPIFAAKWACESAFFLTNWHPCELDDSR